MENILEIKGLTKIFGGLTAINNVAFSVPKGSITAVIGPNGAGKTTLFNMIAGVFPPDKGEIIFDGQRLNGTNAAERVKLGIARTFQQGLLFNDMTVLENIMAGRHARTGSGFLGSGLRLPGMRREEEKTLLDAEHFLNFVEQGRYANQLASEIPLGQQKLVAIGRALATEPKLLLLDESGAGLTPLRKKVFQTSSRGSGKWELPLSWSNTIWSLSWGHPTGWLSWSMGRRSPKEHPLRFSKTVG